MDHNSRTSYRTIMKGTAIFGGVQIFNILINIIRGKIVALFLGPAGLGISALYTSTTSVINQFTGFGLSTGAVKEVSEACETGEKEKVERIAGVLRTLISLSALLAFIVCLAGSPWLSISTFGNYNHTYEFIALSMALFFMTKSTAEAVLLQGTRRLGYLAKSSVTGALAGLVAGTPLYYFYGEKGIVPAMIIMALTTFFINKYFTRKLKLSSVRIPLREVFKEGRQMILFGVTLMITTLFSTIVIYAINIYIRKYGNIDDVGLYQAATSISNQYVGLVFSAMAVDYFPRLSGISNNREKTSEIINLQTDVVLLVITPLLIALILTAPLLINILLTKDFFPVIPLIRWIGLGIFFKALAFPIGYLSFAKGDKKVFFWMEGVCNNISTLILSIAGYRLWGLTGLGIAFTASYCLYLLVLMIVVKLRYGFTANARLLQIIIPLFLALITSFLVFQQNQHALWSYLTTTVILIATSVYVYRMLDKRIGIKEMVRRKLEN